MLVFVAFVVGQQVQRIAPGVVDRLGGNPVVAGSGARCLLTPSRSVTTEAEIKSGNCVVASAARWVSRLTTRTLTGSASSRERAAMVRGSSDDATPSASRMSSASTTMTSRCREVQRQPTRLAGQSREA